MAGFTGIGTTLSRGGVAVANILSIGLPGITRETIDVTTMSAADGFKDFITGLKDGGTLTFEILFTKAGFSAMNTDFLSDSAVAYILTLPDVDTTAISFNGLITGFPLTVPLNDKVSVSVTIKIVGDIDIA